MPLPRWLLPIPLLLAASPAVGEPMTFAEAVTLAEQNAPSLLAGRLTVQAAREDIAPASALPDPTLFVGLENVPFTGPSAWSFTDEGMSMLSVGLTQEVPSAGRRRAGGERAEAIADEAGADLERMRREVATEAAIAWLDVHFLRQRLALLDEHGVEIDFLERTTPSRIAGGLALPVEAVEADSQALDLADQRDDLTLELARAQAELARWTHQPSVDVTGSAPELEVDGPALLSHLTEHPLLDGLRHRTRQSEADLAEARAARRPDWSWEIAYQRRDPQYGDMISARVSIGLPLFQSGRQAPSERARRASVERSIALRLDAELQLVREFEIALARFEVASRQLARLNEELLPLAGQRLRLLVGSYRAGAVELPEVIAARRAWIDVRMRRLELEREIAVEAVRLNFYFGGDLP